MGMTRAEKDKEIPELHERFVNAELVVVARNKGLDMPSMNALRGSARKEQTGTKVAKNTLARRALKGTKFEAVGDMLTGPAMIFTSKDQMSAARVVYNFAKTNEKLEIVGGSWANETLDLEKLKFLATLPSLDALRGKIIGILQAPGAQLARVVNAYATKEQA